MKFIYSCISRNFCEIQVLPDFFCLRFVNCAGFCHNYTHVFYVCSFYSELKKDKKLRLVEKREHIFFSSDFRWSWWSISHVCSSRLKENNRFSTQCWLPHSWIPLLEKNVHIFFLSVDTRDNCDLEGIS